MIDRLIESPVKNPFIFIDTGITRTEKLRYIYQILNAGEKGLLTLTSEDMNEAMYRLEEIEYLMRYKKVIVLDEVIKEINQFLIDLHPKIEKIDKDGTANLSDPAGSIFLKIKNYVTKLENATMKMHSLDPREKLSILSGLPFIDARREYGELFRASVTAHTRVLEERHKRNGHSYADPAIVSVAYTLNTRGHGICVLTTDGDLEQTLLKISPGTVRDLTPRHGELRLVQDPKYKEPILFINPDHSPKHN